MIENSCVRSHRVSFRVTFRDSTGAAPSFHG
jgi:hypothetical protein